MTGKEKDLTLCPKSGKRYLYCKCPPLKKILMNSLEHGGPDLLPKYRKKSAVCEKVIAILLLRNQF